MKYIAEFNIPGLGKLEKRMPMVEIHPVLKFAKLFPVKARLFEIGDASTIDVANQEIWEFHQTYQKDPLGFELNSEGRWVPTGWIIQYELK